MELTTDKSEIINALNDILQFLTDPKSCFEKHVYNVNDDNLSNLFKELVISRKEMIEEVQNQILNLGKIVECKGTFLGKCHMLYENLKSQIMNGDPLTITKEVRRGEGVLIEYYKNALDLKLPPETRQVLLKHLKKINADIAKADILSVV